MDPQLYKLIEQAVSEGLASAKWVLIIGMLFTCGMVLFFGAYLKRKAENIATTEDFKQLLEQLRQTTAATEEIQAGFVQLNAYNQLKGQQLATKENFAEFLQQLEIQTKTTEEIRGEIAKQTAIATETMRVEFTKDQVKDDLWSTQKHSHWSPLLEAVRELKSRFGDLSRVYRKAWTHPFTPESLSGDFRELYMLSRDEIANLEACDPNGPRRDKHIVQKIRTRMSHHLTYAVSSLYITATYLGVAERVQRDLKEHLLLLPNDARVEMIRLLANIRRSLQGNAGIPSEQQEAIAEMVWSQPGGVISNVEFRQRLLELPGWEQFTSLFRFFVAFGPKLDYEVAHTISALRELEEQVDQLSSCSSERDYSVLWHSHGQASSTGGLPLRGPAGLT